MLLGEEGRVFGKIPFFYIPSADLVVQPGDMQQGPSWWHPQGTFGDLVRRLANGLDTLPPPKLTRVTVNGEPVADPNSYLALYTTGKKATTYPSEDTMLQVAFLSAKPSPWTTGNYMVVYPKSHLLVRDGEIVSIPARMADDVVARASLSPDGGTRWLLWAALAHAGAVLAAVLWRVRPRPQPRPVPQA
jgi:hypothetical protein